MPPPLTLDRLRERVDDMVFAAWGDARGLTRRAPVGPPEWHRRGAAFVRVECWADGYAAECVYPEGDDPHPLECGLRPVYPAQWRVPREVWVVRGDKRVFAWGAEEGKQ